MKKLFFISFILILIQFNTFSQTGWYWQHPYPQGNELNAIQMDGSVGWAVGALGTVMKTTNAGNNWEIVDLGTFETLNGVTRNTYGEIWIVGDNGFIIYSSDHGVTWIDYTGVTNENLNSVSFVYGACAWFCGDNNVVLKTTDGGQNWDVFNPGFMLDLNSI
ncbi:MAG: YCF48-related protein, partial [Ignavibacteriaceae bacterium]|nr:YCF48-related protein [Ignavibacteriaceae bacterium]